MRLIALIVLALSLTACTVAVPASTNTSTSETPTSATPTSTAPTPTVTVTMRPKRKTVTHVVVQSPQTTTANVPASGSTLQSIYASAMQSEDGAYYAEDDTYFNSPSGNIACYIVSSGAVCSIHRYEFDQPGPDCNRGIAATVDEDGTPSLTSCSGYFSTKNYGPVLPYGESVSYGDYACVSESTGISCIDLNTYTGFTLSREAFDPTY